MTDEVQNQAAPQGDAAQTAAPAVDQQAAAAVAVESAPPVQSPTPDSPTMTEAPQPIAAAAPSAPAVAEPGIQKAAGDDPVVEEVLNEPVVETAALDAVAGVEHAHSMVSNWLQRVEAGLHVPVDELRALKERLANWL